MQPQNLYGRVHCAIIEFKQSLESLIPEFFSANVDSTADIGVDQSACGRPAQSPLDPLSGKDRLFLRFSVLPNPWAMQYFTTKRMVL